MRFALVKSGIVQNIIVCDQAFADSLKGQFDAILPINEQQTVGPGDLYDGKAFSAAPVLNTESKQLSNADFGRKLMADFAVLNSQRGLTSAQKYQIAQSLSGIASLLLAGDLKATLDILPTIPVDGVLFTQDILNLFMGQIKAYLGQ